MDEEKKKRKKRAVDAGDGGHKKPWQETCATPEEIKAMLSERVLLRYNEVRGRTEIHRLSQGLTIGENDQGLLTIFGGEGGVTDGYTDLDDREENTLWDELCAVKPVIKQHLQNIINSNYVPAYHPFRYYLEHLPPWTPDKGDAIMGLSQYGLMCWEELDSMLPKELNKLKGTMTMPSINERAPYERYHKNRPHLASFCGTGNNVQFLSDTTGTRRWLPFEVESIEPPQENPLDYDAIYAQAYALYQQGFRYWFDQAEIQRLTQHNRQFETVHSELELVDLHFRKPTSNDPRELVSATMALQLIGGNLAYTLSKEKIGQAFSMLGFESKRTASQRGYIAIHRTPAERDDYRRKLAEEKAMTDDSMTAGF